MLRIIAAFFSLAAGCASAADEILWLAPEFPPLVITGTALQGQGYGDGELRYLTSHLPQFRHRIVYATPPRLWHEIGTRDGACTISVAKTSEREKVAAYSARSVHSTANQVIIRTDALANFEAFLDERGHIDLARLGAEGHLRGGYSDGVSYGPAIDNFISEQKSKRPLEIVAHMRTPLPSLDKGRLDYVFGYYMDLEYYRRTREITASFTVFPTKPESEGQDSYIACSKGPRGREILAAIDALQSSDDAMLDYVEALRGWYSPAEFESARKLTRSTEH